MLHTLILGVLLIGSTLIATPGDILKSFPVSSCPSGLTFDGQNLWIADFKSDSIYAFDPTTGKTMNAIPAPTFRPYGLAWDGSYMWVVDAEEDNIIQLDLKAGVNIKTISSPVTSPTGMTWDGKTLWLADQSTINKISTDDGTTIKSFPAPSGSTTGLAFDGTYLWAADRMQNKIYMIYPETGDIIKIIESPGPYPWGLAFVNDKLFNVDFQTDSLYNIVTDDGALYSKTKCQEQNMNYYNEVRNYGPGILKSLDIYLAIPSNSEHQTIIGEPSYFSPVSPQYVTDRWGQPFASFHFENIPSGGSARASYLITADLYETRYFVNPDKVGSSKQIPKDVSEKYLSDDAKFDLKNPVIQNAVKTAIGNESNPYWIARKIYRWVIDHLSYELSGGWNVAPAVIVRGNGSCSEYSFVYIALCRAAGIPARYSGAITIRGDLASEDEVFHRWCEIYLPNYGWLPVDPSGGDTPSPEGQAQRFGFVGNSYLVTTTGAGSEFIDWNYNSGEKWESIGKCKIYSEHIGEWTPAAQTASQQESIPPGGQYCRPLR